MPTITKWDERFLALCWHVAGNWSKDPKKGVGAVLVRDTNKDIVIGYNGFPAGIKDTEERLNDRPLKRKIVIHAELNAILTARRDLTGYTIYSSLKPCAPCTSCIIQSGITTVVYPKLTEECRKLHEAYLNDWALADELLEEKIIKVKEM